MHFIKFTGQFTGQLLLGLGIFVGGVVAQCPAFANDAGCGLGSVIISKNSKGLQLLAMTTNYSFFSQPLGITFGTSGCSSSGLVMNEKEVQYFVEVNQSEIEREMAQGQGEKLRTLSQLSGCQTEAGILAFSKSSKKNFGLIVPRSPMPASEMISHLKETVIQDANVLQACGSAEPQHLLVNQSQPI